MLDTQRVTDFLPDSQVVTSLKLKKVVLPVAPNQSEGDLYHMSNSIKPTATLVFRHIHTSDRSEVRVEDGTLAELRDTASTWIPKGDWYLSGISRTNGDFQAFPHPEVECAVIKAANEYAPGVKLEQGNLELGADVLQQMRNQPTREDVRDMMALFAAFGS